MWLKRILNAGVGQVQKNQIKTSPSQREVKNYISCFCSLFKCSCINGILIFVIFVAIMKEDQGEANAIMCILWLDLDSDWLALLGMLLSTKPRSCNHKSQACTSTRLPNLAIKSLESHAAMPSSQRSNTQKKDYATCLLSFPISVASSFSRSRSAYSMTRNPWDKKTSETSHQNQLCLLLKAACSLQAQT